MQQDNHVPSHPWKARSIVGISIMILAFIGLIITSVWNQQGLYYWLCLTPLLALSCIWLSWYLRSKNHRFTTITLWHEILHWAGMIAAVWLIWQFVRMGVLGRFEAGLIIVVLLALTTFIAGIYIDWSYVIVGFALGLCAAAGAFAQEYLYYFMIPVLLLLAGILIWVAYKMRHYHSQSE